MRKHLATVGAGLITVLIAHVAVACELVQAPTRAGGMVAFVATTSRLPSGDVRADVLIGLSETGAMTRGPLMLVPWSFGPDCKPLPWTTNQRSAWSPPSAAAVYAGELRPRDRWIGGVQTVDVYMAVLQPMFKGEGARDQYPSATGPLLTPEEFLAFYWILPTEPDLAERKPEALARVTRWESEHRQLASREPAVSMLRLLHWLYRPSR